jgi:hypothetical protein
MASLEGLAIEKSQYEERRDRAVRQLADRLGAPPPKLRSGGRLSELSESAAMGQVAMMAATAVLAEAMVSLAGEIDDLRTALKKAQRGAQTDGKS